MKDLKQLLKKKTVGARSTLDEKSILFVFRQVVQSEYGKQGAQNIEPLYLRDKTIGIKAASSHWASELRLNKGQIVRKINERLGGEEIIDLAMAQ